MPEMPEVESVCRDLGRRLHQGARLQEVHFYRPDLRFPIPKAAINGLVGQSLVSIRRRGKYILFVFEKGILLSHLGMTGRWRIESDSPAREKHDHVVLVFKPKLFLVYNDARRFGYLQFAGGEEELKKHPRIVELGLEPLDDSFNSEFLFAATRKVSRAIKVFLMDQKVVVGVGNIYASEILFRAGVKPQRKAARVTRQECEAIVAATRSVLQKAIDAGGSTIRDYRNAQGDKGDFQEYHQVYDRSGEPCLKCGAPLRSAIMGGRNTYWCPNCQK